MCLPLFACFKPSPNHSGAENNPTPNENESEKLFSIKKLIARASAPELEEPSYRDLVLKIQETKKKNSENITEDNPNEDFDTCHLRICGPGSEAARLPKFVTSLIGKEIKYIKESLHSEIESLSVDKRIKSVIISIFEIKRHTLQSFLNLETEEKIKKLAEVCRTEYLTITINEFLAAHLETLPEKTSTDIWMEKNRKRLKKVFDNDAGFQYRYRMLPPKITYAVFKEELEKIESMFHDYIQKHPKIVPTSTYSLYTMAKS